ncbi:hypothetical protein [Nocardiopsis sp. MG754419]|uniref:hypothetical protein n=1 Tax=Nocardiopsis sp. MG754419 TaxID=2259865 RepID=UPI001BAC9F91|nr:hypothetical protein [Nocardiopsis sp. MG754419]MBR8744971.1 hypothetical protein [Nocardiopsis sp. MG754419]
MIERYRLVAPCSGLLLFTLLSTSGASVERFVTCASSPPPTPRVTVSMTCPGTRPRPDRTLLRRRPSHCAYH